MMHPRSPAWLLTASGKRFDLPHPDPSAIDIMDIAQALALQCRYNGQCSVYYSVAQHSVLVMKMVSKPAKPYALLHDAHEAYLGDITSPVKDALDALGAGKALSKLEADVDKVLHRALGLSWPAPQAIAAEVKAADLAMLATERRDLFADSKIWDAPLPAPSPHRIKPQAWPHAMTAFMEAYKWCLDEFAPMRQAAGRTATANAIAAELRAYEERGG